MKPDTLIMWYGRSSDSDLKFINAEFAKIPPHLRDAVGEQYQAVYLSSGRNAANDRLKAYTLNSTGKTK